MSVAMAPSPLVANLSRSGTARPVRGKGRAAFPRQARRGEPGSQGPRQPLSFRRIKRPSTIAGRSGHMSGFGWIAWIVIGIIAGWLAEQIMGRNHGLLTNLIVGVVGALIGGFLYNTLLGADAGGNWIVGIIVATLGAIVLLFLLGLVKRRA